MSEEAVIDPPATFAEVAVPLLREYHQKLLALREQLRELKTISIKQEYGDVTPRIVAAEFNALSDFLKQFRPAGLKLARQVSGMIDQGKLTPLERVELELRLSEFETALRASQNLLNAYQSS